MVEDSEHALGAGWCDGVVERGREVADDQAGAEDRAACDVPAVAAQRSMHDHHDEGSHREAGGDPRGDAVGDLLAQGVLATDDGERLGCRGPIMPDASRPVVRSAADRVLARLGAHSHDQGASSRLEIVASPLRAQRCRPVPRPALSR